MKVFISFTTIILLIVSSDNSSAQVSKTFSDGFAIEVGLGYNQIHRHLVNPNGPMPLFPGSMKKDIYYEAIKLTPSIRFSYEIQINNSVYISPFLEYSFIEGKSDDGFESPLSVHSINLGLLPSYNYKNFQFTGGIKYNSFIKRKDKNMIDWFAPYTFDYGFRLSYKISDIIISAEGWYNISTLSSPEYENLYEWNYCRYNFLIGYRF
jgi:hypothetical protein